MLTTLRATSAACAVAIGSVLACSALVMSPAEARGNHGPARNDIASVVAGQSVTVKVLANDKVARRGARVKVFPSSSTGVSAKVVNRKKVRITTTSQAAQRLTRLTYRVTDRRGRTDRAVIKLTVKAGESPAAPTTTTATTSTTTSEPTTATPTTTTTSAQPEADTLLGRIDALPVADEVRTGYDRTTWKHWSSGTGGISYCDTRDEVLISESIVTATWSGTSCSITGQWHSYYDGVSTTDASTFDIDHMVALAEAHDSGGHAWTAATKEAFANDQGDPRSLVAVSASSNRSKGDRDPGEWLPLLERCRYIGEWVAVKHRWDLSVDQVEKDALTLQASNCENVVITVMER